MVQEYIDPRKLQSTWPVVYSAFVSKEEDDRVFTLEEKSSNFLYYKTIANGAYRASSNSYELTLTQ